MAVAVEHFLMTHFGFSEFLVGGWLLSAPVLQQGQTSRNIYLPQGVWRDGITDIPIQGPTWLMDYPAPLDVLPYFIKELV